MPPQRRHRSTVACQKCRGRKVRCSVTVTGIPCIRCAQDGTECTVKDDHHTLPPSSLSSVAVADAGSTTARPGANEHDPGTARLHRNTHSQEISYVTNSSRGSSLTRQSNATMSPQLVAEHQRNMDEERSGAEISHAVRGQGGADSDMPFYTGERPGVTAVIDVCSQPQSPMPRHVLLRSAPRVSMSEVDRDYLQAKGVFNLPREASRRELLQAYFHNLHPILPILDVGILNRLHHPEGISIPELLIFWSLASIAVNYVQSSMWQLEGFHFRKELRDRFYELAKCTFNVGGVTDKERLLQSALLLGFWHLDRDSHSQPWHWTGIAVSLCQIIGLHRNPDSVKINHSVTQHRRRIWRRLWGACIFRDRWLSLTLGRPMRIHLKDCDMPFPTVEDVMGDVTDITASLRDLYLPPDLAQLSECGMAIVQFSKALESIVSLGYQQSGLAPTLQQCEDLEGELLRSDICELAPCQGSRVGAFFSYHAQLHYQATLITFYRPFLAMTPSDLPPAAEGPWRDGMRNRLEAAAASTNAIVDSIVREGLISYAGPMTPPLLVPAMHVHLLNCKSENPLIRTLGHSKLELCMAVMHELQKTYTSASIFCGIFSEVLAQLSRDYTPSQSSGWASQSRPAGSIPTQGVAPEPGPPDQEQIPFDNELLERLLNESLANNMWESMSMLDHSFDLPNEGW